MFNREFPDWIAELESKLNYSEFEDCIVEEEDLWIIIRQQETPPNIGAAWIAQLFSNIERHLVDTYGELFEGQVKYEVSGRGSYLTIDGTNITTAQQLIELVDSKKPNLGKVIYFNEMDTYREDRIAIVIVSSKDESVEVEVEIFNKEGGGAGARICGQDGAQILDDAHWEETPSEELLETYDFSVDVEVYLDETKGKK